MDGSDLGLSPYRTAEATVPDDINGAKKEGHMKGLIRYEQHELVIETLNSETRARPTHSQLAFSVTDPARPGRILFNNNKFLSLS